MFERLAEIQKRFLALGEQLGWPDVVSDPARFRDLSREYKALAPIAEAYGAWLRADAEGEEAARILASEQDAELRELAQLQQQQAKQRCGELAEALRELLLPKDENDDRNVIMEIRAGTGGEEAALFAADLFRMYSMFAASEGFRLELLSSNETELGGFKEICFSVSGAGAYSRLKFESGVHRVQRVPQTETQGRIQTSTVTVATLPEAEEVELQINPKDLQIDTFRSSGAGGQHVNKTESAIRITHLPTGLVVECQDERSQYKNKERALKILRSRLLDEKRREQEGRIAAQRKSQVGSGDRSERIRTYNYPQGRVTDHRINLTLYKLEAVLSGDLSELLDALMAADRAEKLRDSAL